jgi:aryl-alcohol dehydrogenase-like predicted oxidoreductase
VTARVRLGASELSVFPLCLGGNVFGWTADAVTSFQVLDAYVAAGGNFIDSADSYSAFAPGLHGGESETMLGRWMTARGNRHEIVLATKVGRKPGAMGLAPANIRAAVEASLARLQTDYIDLYYAHADDPAVPLQDTLGAFDELVRAGTVRHIAASNYAAPRLARALEISDREGLARFTVLQPEYSLVARERYEGELSGLCARERLSCVPYWALARGFLTGKYRPGIEVDSPRAGAAGAYLDERGLHLLATLDAIAADRGTSVTAVSLAWVAAQATVAAPIASARTPEQLSEVLAMVALALGDDELAALNAASPPASHAPGDVH